MSLSAEISLEHGSLRLNGTLRADPGEIVVLLGPNGAGKTTMLRAIAGLLGPVGLVELGGRTLDGPGGWVPPEQRRLGVVFQDLLLFPHLTVEQNVALAARWAGHKGLARVEACLDRFGLRDMRAEKPTRLSGGERQTRRPGPSLGGGAGCVVTRRTLLGSRCDHSDRGETNPRPTHEGVRGPDGARDP